MEDVGGTRDLSPCPWKREGSRMENDDMQMLLDNIETQVWYLIDERTYGLVNQAHANFWGLKKEDLENKDLYELMSSREEAGACIERNLEVFSKKQKVHTEELVLNGRGEERLLSITKTLKLDRHNNVEYVVCFAKDITKNKKKEEELEKNEERFQKMLSLVPDMVSIHDNDMNILYSNWKGFGAVPEEKRVLNTKCYKTYRDRDDICPDCHAVQVLNTKEAFQEEVRLPEGNWVDLRVIPILGKDGSLELFVEWVRDITAQKQHEQEIISQQKLLEGIMDNVTDVLAIQHPDLSIARYNQAGYDLLGMTPEEVNGKKCYELIGREQKCEKCATYKALQSGEAVQLEKYVPELGIYLECRSKPVLDQDGNVMQVVQQLSDISERKITEKQLQEAYRKLNEEVYKAKEIHQRVLPSELPKAENISLAAYHQPATQMGGDSYNAIRVGNKLVVYVADVMGHGLDGAMLSVFIKEAIDSYISLKEEIISPKRILQHLNIQYHRENFPEEQLICIFIGIIDLDTNEFKYSSAGFQTNPLVNMGNGEKKKLDTKGMFISNSMPLDAATFEEKTITLTPGTTMLITTDGLTEQGNGEDFFMRYLDELFYDKSYLPPESIVQAINKNFCLFNNGRLTGDDDIAYLVLKVNTDRTEQHLLEIVSSFENISELNHKIEKLTAGFPNNTGLIACVHELVVNAIEHGNKFDLNKKVKINLTITPDYVLVEVGDEGEGFNWCEQINKPCIVEDLGERGRGISLARELSSDLYYNIEGNKATLLFEAYKEEF